jgi:MazG family protein
MSDAKPYADLERFERLYAIIRHLRDPGGCAWDREQTPESMRGALVEEVFEIVDAVEIGDIQNLEEEIGDLFLVASSILRMQEEAGRFGPDQVFDAVCAKLVRRHPHVFGDANAPYSAEKVIEQWERIKKTEPGKDRDGSAVSGVPRGLPPLERAGELQRKAAKVGFDWDDATAILAKLQEEREELEAALAGTAGSAAIEEEIGDLLFTVVNLGRKLGVDPARALAATNRKFEARFREMERRIHARGGDLASMTLTDMDAVWDEVKRG